MSRFKRILFAAPWWHEELMRGVAAHAAERGWHLNLETALNGRLPERWQGDGILTTLGGDAGATKAFLARAACPAVSLSLNHPEFDLPRVGFDNAAAGRLAAEHFLGRNFRSFAFYDRVVQYAGDLRREAFAATLATGGYGVHNLAGRDGRRTGNTWVDRQRGLRRELPRLPQPLAVFAADDAGAVEVIEACQSEGLAIPDQVGVLGMLDIPVFRASTTVPLSSITVDFDTQTREACRILGEMMDGATAPREPLLFPPTGIAPRASTDTLAARTPSVARAIRYLFDHYQEPVGLPDIVRASGRSQSRLYADFQKDIGQTPGAVLNRIRLDRAARLLRDTDDKIEAIADTCGFGDRINLYRNFRRHLGMSPGQYRMSNAE